MKKSAFKLDTKSVVAIGIGAALYGVLGLISFPVGPNTYMKPAIAILTIFGALFGPAVSFLVGFIGHVITDMVYGGIWWGWVLQSAITAGFMGFVYTRDNFDINTGSYSKGDIRYLTIMGIIGTAIGLLVASTFDIILFGEPATKVYVQMGIAFVVNTLTFVLLGIPAVLALLKMNKKNSNLRAGE